MTIDEKREILNLIAENISVEANIESECDYGDCYKIVTVTLTISDPETNEIIDQKNSSFSFSLD